MANVPLNSNGSYLSMTTPMPITSMARRTSYASVVSGAAAAAAGTSQSYSQPLRSGFMNQGPPNNFNPQYRSDHAQRSSDPLDGEGLEVTFAELENPWGRHVLPPYSRKFSNINMYGLSGFNKVAAPAFFTPKYLESSRYLEQLKASHDASQLPQQDLSSTQTSISASSSSVNLHRMAPSHRGMTYDIIENHTQSSDDELTPLPSKWAETDKNGGLDIAADGLEIKYVGPSKTHDHEAAAARSDNPIPPQCGLYYYEVTVLSKGKEGMIAVGFSSQNASLERLPGWEPESWAYHSDDGKSFCCQNIGRPYGDTFTVGAIIGCCINFRTGEAFFTNEGRMLPVAFSNILQGSKLYPSVGMKKPGAHIRVNFGQSPFFFNIDKLMETERNKVQMEIIKTPLRPNFAKDENSLIQELVAQFLSHDGYVETARAFAEEVRAEAKALNKKEVFVDKYCKDEDDMDAIHRQKIRSAILEGDIDRALKYTNTYYSNVLQDNKDILFRLRCRKFIEMLRKCSELQSTATANCETSKVSNGNESVQSDDSVDLNAGETYSPDMEVDTIAENPYPDTSAIEDDGDEHMHDTSSDQCMLTEPEASAALNASSAADNMAKYHEILQQAVEFGQQLRLEHGGDKRKEVQKTLEDTFSLLAYSDPRESVFGHLLETKGRVTVAEELNSAILVSLGKSSSAALERIYQQTEVLVDELSKTGGSGAFVNVKKDCFLNKG